MRIAYLDCFSGISGNMFLGALLDAGLDFEELKRTLRTLPLDGYSLEVKQEEKWHLFGTRFAVRVKRGKQEHRGLTDIKKIIRAGSLSKRVEDKSIEIFEAIAGEERKVRFHGVGAVDSIIDIVGTVFGIESLGITSISASLLPLGNPTPCTISLLKGIPVYDSGLKHELVTSTGAALVKGLASSFGSMPPMIADRVGYAAGSRNLPDRPNFLRIIIGYDQSEQHLEPVVILEANLDDTNPEWLGFLMDRLLDAGALDVVFCPVQMKNNRPGILLQVMGRPHQGDGLMDLIFRESAIPGIRFRYTRRKVLKRSLVEIESPWGKIKVKNVLQPNGASFFLPEYEACRKIAEKESLPIKEIYYWVMSSNRDPTRINPP